MNKHEEELYILIVELFVDEYPDNNKKADGVAFFDATLVRGWIRMRHALVQLGLATGDPRASSLTSDSTVAREKLTKQVPDSPTLDELLYIFLEVFSSYGSAPHVPTTRKPFNVAVKYYEIMEQLVLLGYALKANDIYIWTFKIAPIMQSFSQWNDNFEDADDIHDRSIQIALDTLSPELELEIINTGDPFKSISIISSKWDGKKWLPNPTPRDHDMRAAFEIYRDICERFKSKTK